MWPVPLILMGPLLQVKKFHAGACLPDHASSNVSGEAVRTLTDARSNPPSERKTQFCLLLKLRADAISENVNSNSPLNPELIRLLEGAWGFIWVLVGTFSVCNTYLKCTALERGKTSTDIRPIHKHHFRTLFQFHSRALYHTRLQNPN